MKKQTSPEKASKKPKADTAQSEPGPAHDVKAHLEALGISCTVLPGGGVTIKDAAALLRHLTDEGFIGRGITVELSAAPPVPVHRVDNPIGGLQEWCQRRGPNAKMPNWLQTENVGTVQAPRFRCTVLCDGLKSEAEDASKAGAKRKSAQLMLEQLAAKHGAERPGP